MTTAAADSSRYTDARERFLAERLTGIGSSDAPIIMGLEAFGKGKLRLYAEKRGEIPSPDLGHLEYVEVGKEIEPACASLYSRRTGRVVTRPNGLAIWSPFVGEVERHPEHDFMIAHCDFKADPLNDPESGIGTIEDGDGPVETKWAGFFKAKDWEEDVPLAYQIQLQHQLVVTGKKWGALASILGTGGFVWREIRRNDYFCDALVRACKEFWDRVQNGDPPKAGGSDGDREALNMLYKKDDSEKTITLPLDMAGVHMLLVATKEEIKGLEKTKSECEASIKQAMADATYGILPNGEGRYKWKKSQTKGYTVEPGVRYDFRHLKS